MLDEELRLALEEYDEVILASLPEPSQCDHQFSPRFERKMRTLCRRAKHPVAYQTLRRVACVLLALLALFGGIMAFNAEARAAVLDWLKETFGVFSHYSYQGEEPPAEEERKRYELGWLPDRFILVDTFAVETGETAIFFGESTEMLQFSYVYGTGKEDPKDSMTPVFIGGSDYQQKTVMLKNGTADVYLALNTNENNVIIWTNAESNVLFCITAPCGENDLIKIAENIIEKNLE